MERETNSSETPASNDAPTGDASSSAIDVAAETPADANIEREISLEEFDPKGTLAVAGIYFLILVVMWVLIYFFEFASRVPSIQ